MAYIQAQMHLRYGKAACELPGKNYSHAAQKVGICEEKQIEDGFCEEQNIGEFILAANATEKSKNLILTDAVHLKDSKPIKYEIKKTGYYCVLTDKYTANDYTAVVEFRNAYGELPATQIPKLPFYGGITILYALVAVFWGFLYYQHHADICMSAPVFCMTGRKRVLTDLQWLCKIT